MRSLGNSSWPILRRSRRKSVISKCTRAPTNSKSLRRPAASLLMIRSWTSRQCATVWPNRTLRSRDSHAAGSVAISNSRFFMSAAEGAPFRLRQSSGERAGLAKPSWHGRVAEQERGYFTTRQPSENPVPFQEYRSDGSSIAGHPASKISARQVQDACIRANFLAINRSWAALIRSMIECDLCCIVGLWWSPGLHGIRKRWELVAPQGRSSE